MILEMIRKTLPFHQTDSSAEIYSYIVAGALITCSYGNLPRKLTMPFSHGVYIKNLAQLNIMDYQPHDNIMPFGLCSSPDNPAVVAADYKPVPCQPVVNQPWVNGKEDVLIENQPALLSCSHNMCLYCGVITIEEDGQ